MTGYLTRGSSNGLGKLPSRLAQAVAEGPITAPHSPGTHLGWVVGIGYSAKIEVEASEALEVLEVGLAPRAGPMVEGLLLNGSHEILHEGLVRVGDARCGPSDGQVSSVEF
ncbi:hypothetical protein B296_00019783 [Ensete ventricosum]|uniref:Uncharacterized protein n=1 Tax=Ensete ventricosum TaxID=4639 RepID=A0A426YUJ5_ENSVE|nr:hypothetical protein B296_00019783 [Ensete ventricosum]